MRKILLLSVLILTLQIPVLAQGSRYDTTLVFSCRTNGIPVPGSVIQIRCKASMPASDAPLIVVDGEIKDSAAMSAINPSDISNITILRNVSATALYGDKASNGVIIITTKNTKQEQSALSDTKDEGSVLSRNGFVNTEPGLRICTQYGDGEEARRHEEFSKAAVTTSVYPNPARAGQSINILLNGSVQGTIRIWNSTGKLIQSSLIDEKSSFLHPLPQVAAGAYILSVTNRSGRNILSETILIQ